MAKPTNHHQGFARTRHGTEQGGEKSETSSSEGSLKECTFYSEHSPDPDIRPSWEKGGWRWRVWCCVATHKHRISHGADLFFDLSPTTALRALGPMSRWVFGVIKHHRTSSLRPPSLLLGRMTSSGRSDSVWPSL